MTGGSIGPARGLALAAACLLLSANAQASHLQFTGSVKAVDGPYPLVGAHGVAVSPDGRDVYAASFDDNALVVLARSGSDGRLSFTQAAIDGEDGVSGIFRAVAVTVSPDGKDVYVASFFGDAVAAFRRDADNGTLTYTTALFGGGAGIVGLTQLQGVAVSPDGAHVYVASFGDSAVSLLRRDASTGGLQFVEAQIDGQDGVTGIFRASGVAVSPDGANVYALGGGDNSVVVFGRDSTSGSLEFVEVHEDGVDGVSGLLDCLSLAVSADAADVYALGANGLAHFRRDLGDGRLAFVANQIDGVLNSEGTSGPTGVAVSPNGEDVYVTRGGDDTLAVLRRNLLDGSLQFVEAHANGAGGVDSLAGATTVAVSPDSLSVYVAAQFGDAIASFRVAPLAGDCNGDDEVTVDELLRAVAIALEEESVSTCLSADADGDGQVTIDEIIMGVNNALDG